jgi:hypothetical protein
LFCDIGKVISTFQLTISKSKIWGSLKVKEELEVSTFRGLGINDVEN